MEKSIIRREGRSLIRLGDKMIEYNDDFQLFLVTNKSNPFFLPEIFIKTTVINFNVTFEGLEEQLLGEVVKIENPIIEKQRDEFIVNLSRDKKILDENQIIILELLAKSVGNILDDEDLISTLQESKTRSFEIEKNIEESDVIQVKLTESRNLYRNVAVRGTLLYFVVCDLSSIDSMYQNSLNYFKKLFISSLIANPQNVIFLFFGKNSNIFFFLFFSI